MPMTRQRLNAILATILTTLAEFPDCAESTCYMLLDSDIEQWEAVRGIMTTAGLITIKGYRVALTAKGREMADKCNEVLKGGA